MTRVPVNTFLEVFSQGAWCFTDQHHKISTILFPDYPNITVFLMLLNVVAPPVSVKVQVNTFLEVFSQGT